MPRRAVRSATWAVGSRIAGSRSRGRSASSSGPSTTTAGGGRPSTRPVGTWRSSARSAEEDRRAPAGATNLPAPDILRVAERYRDLLELGDQMGVVPQVEVWGFSATLGRLGEAALVAMESGHPRACILHDVYHLYKGGSRLRGLEFLEGSAMHLFHMNDYPADPPRAAINDAHRVYPGDGVAPLRRILRTLRDNGYRGMLSLELFNRDYWRQDALTVARTGLEKMRAVVRESLAR
ncbi:MAG: TIM barrel protein [Singulisphaera sp.]